MSSLYQSWPFRIAIHIAAFRIAIFISRFSINRLYSVSPSAFCWKKLLFLFLQAGPSGYVPGMSFAPGPSQVAPYNSNMPFVNAPGSSYPPSLSSGHFSGMPGPSPFPVNTVPHVPNFSSPGHSYPELNPGLNQGGYNFTPAVPPSMSPLPSPVYHNQSPSQHIDGHGNMKRYLNGMSHCLTFM